MRAPLAIFFAGAAFVGTTRLDFHHAHWPAVCAVMLLAGAIGWWIAGRRSAH